MALHPDFPDSPYAVLDGFGARSRDGVIAHSPVG